MKPHRILDPDQFHASRVCCSFGITETIAAVAAFAGDAFATGGAALGIGEAAGAAGAAGIGEAAATGLGAEALGAGAAEGLAAGGGLAEGAGLAGAGAEALGGATGALDFAGLTGEAGLAGTGALDAAGAAAGGLPTASALEAGAGAAGAGASAIPAAGAVTSPLAALDAGAATGVLDAGAGAGGELGAAGGSLAGTAATDTLNPMNWLSFEATDAATGAPVASGTFPTAAETAANTAAANPFTASVGEALPGLNAANDAIDTAASGFSAPSTGALASAGSTAGNLAESGSTFGKAALDSAGGGSTFGNIMGGLKTVAPLVPLASLGMTLAKGQPGLPPQEQQAEAAAGGLLSTGQQNLNMAANQQITAPQTAEIETWKQQQMNALYQLYAKSGRDPNTDTDYLQGVQQINQQAIGMQQQFIDQLIKTGLGETGQATSVLQAGAQMQIQQDQAFQQSISAAISSFGLTAGLSGLTLAKAA